MAPSSRLRPIRSWGGLSSPGVLLESEDLAAAARRARMSRGLGRAYGDAALPVPGDTVASCVPADRLLAFDPDSGILRAEAGLSLQEIHRRLLPRGWAIPVSPGTQYVTLGGMVAADVHGKNHHVAGCIGAHVERLKLLVADGRAVECSRERHPDLFRATLGGMGLTGHILEVALKLERVPTGWILAESFRVDDLEALLAGLRDSRAEWPFTAAWIDCLSRGSKLGRGVIHRGRWARPEEASTDPPGPRPTLRVPFTAPDALLNRISLRAFNGLYYRIHPRRPRPRTVHPESFFYPLDTIRDWHRLYGRRGLTQYQCVVPGEAGIGAVERILEAFITGGGTSFLSVLKDCGPEGEGTLSFPRAGSTLALDLPMTDDAGELVNRLNRLLLESGGRVYLAKDALTSREHFEAMEVDRLEAWREVKRRWDPDDRIRSALGARLLLPQEGPPGRQLSPDAPAAVTDGRQA